MRWRETVLRDVDGLRLIAPEHLHATLCFLGWRPVVEIGEILRACGILGCLRVPAVGLGAAVWLSPRRPRVLAVELEDPTGALPQAQSALSCALHAGGWYVPESRPFLAHVTVARVVKGARPRARELPPPPRVAFPGSRVTLYRSRLSQGGARYEPLGTIELDAGETAPADSSANAS
jgi:2'-5' RNA ligase